MHKTHSRVRIAAISEINFLLILRITTTYTITTEFMMRTWIALLICSIMLTACGTVPKTIHYGASWDSMNYGNYASISAPMVSISPGMK